MWIDILKPLEPLVMSFVAAAAFGIIYNVPRVTVWAGGFAGMIGWIVYKGLSSEGRLDSVFATIAATFVVAMICQHFARRYKMPVIVFSIAGIIPMVPGGTAYNAMREFVENNHGLALQYASEACLVSGAIAFGLLLGGVFTQIIKKQSEPTMR
ncbi:threonine/serine exporter family protein [Bacillus sp. B190/17]|uniref:Threonine/serine exporter family protein n=1 Tax=Bacillus lumedeiriae TaxID=3058829 RepID=A0ABW8ICJ5_9BACI